MANSISAISSTIPPIATTPLAKAYTGGQTFAATMANYFPAVDKYHANALDQLTGGSISTYMVNKLGETRAPLNNDDEENSVRAPAGVSESNTASSVLGTTTTTTATPTPMVEISDQEVQEDELTAISMIKLLEEFYASDSDLHQNLGNKIDLSA